MWNATIKYSPVPVATAPPREEGDLTHLLVGPATACTSLQPLSLGTSDSHRLCQRPNLGDCGRPKTARGEWRSSLLEVLGALCQRTSMGDSTRGLLCSGRRLELFKPRPGPKPG